jgi:hypothetical protein
MADISTTALEFPDCQATLLENFGWSSSDCAQWSEEETELASKVSDLSQIAQELAFVS